MIGLRSEKCHVRLSIRTLGFHPGKMGLTPIRDSINRIEAWQSGRMQLVANQQTRKGPQVQIL